MFARWFFTNKTSKYEKNLDYKHNQTKNNVKFNVRIRAFIKMRMTCVYHAFLPEKVPVLQAEIILVLPKNFLYYRDHAQYYSTCMITATSLNFAGTLSWTIERTFFWESAVNMDSKVDQPLLEPHQRQPMYSHLETKDYDYNEPKLIEQIEHIELRDADAPVILSGGSGQNETIQVTTAETITAEEKTAKKCKTTKQHTEQPLTMGLNVYDRDEKNINGHVRVSIPPLLWTC